MLHIYKLFVRNAIFPQLFHSASNATERMVHHGTETLCCQRQSIAEPQPHNKYCQKRMRSDEHSFSSGKKPAQQDSHINTEINSGRKYPSKGGHLFSPFYCY